MSESEEPDELSGESPKKNNKMLFIIIGAAVLLLGGGGAGLYFTGMLDGLLGVESATAAEESQGDEGKDGHAEDAKDAKKKDSHAAKKDDGHGEKKKDDGHGAKKDDGHGKEGGDGKDGGPVYTGGPGAYFLKMPDMIVNLNSGEGGAPRFLRLAVQLEIAEEEDVLSIHSVMPRVVDQFQTYLRELRVRDLRGSAGIYRLQLELLKRVNRASAPAEVKDVLFQEILIQ